MIRALLALVLWSVVGTAFAHSMNTAQWRLSQRDAQTWSSQLRLPEDIEGELLTLHPRWPADCTRLDAPRTQPTSNGSVLNWTLRCPDGLVGELALDGFSARLPDAVLQFEPLGAAPRHVVLSATRPAWTISAVPEPPPVAHYFPLGVEHILRGPDHLLFVLGLWALWRRSGRGASTLVGTLTAFTIAHSITLAGAALGGWQLPVAAVEACIAASILLLAVELATGERGIASRAPARVAFAFGLLHGFGFAGALAQTGLPDGARAWALAAFNLGVEAGQLLFVLALVALAAMARPALRYATVALTVYGAAAAYWLIERSAGVFAG
ncbi:HupE/UreJ family protein [Fontimonas sp. SYSU GA230001]|uniref:HupE/UreJ family protein n=1 Tax=Fontimonas sp. SYSU GA230001 TaxID=3142450 RepID=UPI0032B4FF25